MDFFAKQKTWFFISIFSLVVNVILIGNFWRHRCGRHHRRADAHCEQMKSQDAHRVDFLKERLILTAEQGFRLGKIVESVRLQKDSIHKLNERYKYSFEEELYKDAPSQGKLDSLMRGISTSTEVYNRVRVSFVTQITAMCSAEQRKKLPSVLRELAERSHHGWRKNNMERNEK